MAATKFKHIKLWLKCVWLIWGVDVYFFIKSTQLSCCLDLKGMSLVVVQWLFCLAISFGVTWAEWDLIHVSIMLLSLWMFLWMAGNKNKSSSAHETEQVNFTLSGCHQSFWGLHNFRWVFVMMSECSTDGSGCVQLKLFWYYFSSSLHDANKNGNFVRVSF